eukprot:1378474-Rhodomonas_salina.1
MPLSLLLSYPSLLPSQEALSVYGGVYKVPFLSALPSYELSYHPTTYHPTSEAVILRPITLCAIIPRNIILRPLILPAIILRPALPPPPYHPTRFPASYELSSYAFARRCPVLTWRHFMLLRHVGVVHSGMVA